MLMYMEGVYVVGGCNVVAIEHGESVARTSFFSELPPALLVSHSILIV